MADNTVLTGLVKDNIRRDASVTLLADGKEKVYNGSDLLTAETANGRFTCIKGDFFKIVAKGELSFLQKSSDASSQVTFNGNEAMLNSGTEGTPGDYFIYNSKANELKLVSKKNLNEVISNSFNNYSPAVEKAKTAKSDITILKEAVEIYNNRSGK